MVQSWTAEHSLGMQAECVQVSILSPVDGECPPRWRQRLLFKLQMNGPNSASLARCGRRGRPKQCEIPKSSRLAENIPLYRNSGLSQSSLIPAYRRGGRTSSRARAGLRWTQQCRCGLQHAGRDEPREHATNRACEASWLAYGETVWSCSAALLAHRAAFLLRLTLRPVCCRSGRSNCPRFQRASPAHCEGSWGHFPRRIDAARTPDGVSPKRRRNERLK